MKILLIHQHYRTPAMGGAIRSWYLANALAADGMEVVVLSGGQYPSVLDAGAGVTVEFLGPDYANEFGFGKRSFAFLIFVWRAILAAGRHRDANFAYIISTPLTTGLIGWWLKWRRGLPFVFEVGDLWPEAPVQLGFIRNRLLQKLLYRFEKFIYQRAIGIVALSPAIRDYIARIASSEKIVLIPNMSDCQFYQPAEKDPVLVKRFGVEHRLVVSYIGAAGYANGLEYFVACAESCAQANLNVKFFLCGAGARLASLKERVAAKGLSNFMFLEFTAREGVRDLLNVTDIQFICYRPEPVLETGSPNKYFDGLAAGKVIAVNFGGWIKDEILAQGCGIALDPRRPDQFAVAITPCLDPQARQPMAAAARTLALAAYDRTILGARLVAAIRQWTTK